MNCCDVLKSNYEVRMQISNLAIREKIVAELEWNKVKETGNGCLGSALRRFTLAQEKCEMAQWEEEKALIEYNEALRKEIKERSDVQTVCCSQCGNRYEIGQTLPLWRGTALGTHICNECVGAARR